MQATPVARQQIPNTHQSTNWEEVLSTQPVWQLRGATIEELLEAMFSTRFASRCYNPEKSKRFSQLPSVRRVVGRWEMSTSLEVSSEIVAGQWGREQGSWWSYDVGSCYQATTGEDTVDWEDLACAVVNWRVCELATEL
jgi:hypothetical protein